MSNDSHPNTSSTRPGVGTRIKGVFETAHGIGENVRGRTLGVIDDMTKSGTPERTSHYTSMADRGRMETETGMAHIYGYADPNTENVSHNEPGRIPQPTSGIPGSGHTTATGPGTSLAEHDDDGRGDVGSGVGRQASGYGTTDDGSGRPGSAQNLEQQPTIDRNPEMGPSNDPRMGRLSPNRGPPNAGPDAGWSPTSQAGGLTPSQQRVGRDFPPDLPPRPQGQAADNDQHGQMYQ